MTDTLTLQLALQTLNFTEKEALVYLTVLELNEALPSVIAKKVGLKRPTTYITLEHLLQRGLLTSIKKRKLLYYQAINPESFIAREKKRINDSQTKLQVLEKSLPELLSFHQKYTATPQMSVFYGKEGLIQIMEDTLSTKEELLCWSNVAVAESTFMKEYHPTYVRKKIRRKIWSKCLFTPDKVAIHIKKQSKKQLREVRFIPKSKYEFENEINIYDDKVSIISHRDQLGIIIQSQAIADSQRALFYLAFENAGPN